MQRTDYREDLSESYCSHQLAAGRKGMAHNSSLEFSFTHHIQKHNRDLLQRKVTRIGILKPQTVAERTGWTV